MRGGGLVPRPNPKNNIMYGTLHRIKKAFRCSRPQPGCHLPNSPWAVINDVIYKLFLPRESLLSDILAGSGNIEKLFLRCMPEFTITSPYVHVRVDSNTFTMGNPMPESTLSLCQSRLYQSGTLDLASEVLIFIRSCNLGGEGCGLCAEYAEVAVKGPCHRCPTQHFLGVFCK
jgi:hypothetical protein